MVARNTDRIFILEAVDPDNKKLGVIDPAVLEGKNHLHAVMDPQTLMWTFKYEKGIVPGPLKNRYTDFKSLKQQAEVYFRTRNIKIKEIID